MSALALDYPTLYAELLAQVRALLARPEWVGAQLVGIWSGGAWLARELHRDLGRDGEPGVISSRLHRDDFGARGLAATADATKLTQSIDGAPVLLIDDVLHTGRTTRAVLNELFDFGRAFEPVEVRVHQRQADGGRIVRLDEGERRRRHFARVAQRGHDRARQRGLARAQSAR